MPFDAGIVAEVQAKVDLLAYVSQYVTLKKRGREYVGLCPFHAEKTPSFSLNAEKQLWHCYGCDAGGDLLKFVQRYENVDFTSALRMLAARAGVTLHESADARRKRTEREAIFEANGVAQAFFASMLRKDRGAREYLRARGVDDDTAEQFGLGYAPDAWDGLAGAVRKAGVDVALAARAGLLRARPQGDGYYDFFRHRLMFPIYNLTGEVMAFGGRALGDDVAKYINTENTAAYTKGRHVYALNLARRAAAAEGSLVVVEGYMDAIALHQAGFRNAVASLGTAFTPEQARELRRVADVLYLCFDGDTAGQEATIRSIDMLVKEGLKVNVVTLPPGEDPDELLREEGAEALRARLDAPVSWHEFKIDAIVTSARRKYAGESEVAREILKTVNQEPDIIVRDKYMSMIALRLGIDEHTLRRVDFGGLSAMHAQPRIESQGRKQLPFPTLSTEREILRLLFVRPALLAHVADAVKPEEFEDPHLASIFQRLLNNRVLVERGINPMSFFPEDALALELTQLATALPSVSIEDDEERLRLQLERFERRRRERRLWSIDEELNRLLKLGQSVPEALREEYNALAASLRGNKAKGNEG